MKDRRVLMVILDMLAGHWDKDVIVPFTGLQPPNVLGYVEAGKLPVFQECISNGIFVYCWNKGNCNTAYGQKYLASGTYKGIEVAPGADPYCRFIKGGEIKTILTACKERYPSGKVASFGSDAWMQTGWWKAPDATYGWGSYFSDFLTTQTCFKWMMESHDWKMVLLYLAQYDKTGNCPLFKEGASYTEDKHHSLLYLDKLLWMIKEFLKENNWWEETYLFIGSDHGCHYGCNISVEEGRKRGIPDKELINYCSNHQEPYDCYLWDFKRNKSTDKRLDCTRRTTFIISGGGLEERNKGKVIPYGEIIDFAPTIAKLMDIEFPAEGKSLV
ncbi:MAG TPA: sulfatase-like hydrolase/transferase [bacterium]|nr:sulfatase-like hydrolase/transferase [bacterium]